MCLPELATLSYYHWGFVGKGAYWHVIASLGIMPVDAFSRCRTNRESAMITLKSAFSLQTSSLRHAFPTNAFLSFKIFKTRTHLYLP